MIVNHGLFNKIAVQVHTHNRDPAFPSDAFSYNIVSHESESQRRITEATAKVKDFHLILGLEALNQALSQDLQGYRMLHGVNPPAYHDCGSKALVVPDVLGVQCVRVELALLLPLFRDAEVHLVQRLKHGIYVLTVRVYVQICIKLFRSSYF